MTRSIDVPLGPAEAFRLFTDEIDRWFVRGPYSWADPQRARGIRFEPGVGGRLVEIWDAATGEGYDLGRVVAWEPGARIGLLYRFPGLPGPESELTVRFEAAPGGARVTLTHTVDGLSPGEARAFGGRSWKSLLAAFARYAANFAPA
ncbi:MAG: SRPBCC domain-containing protein [Dehalococcoidia bacterium]